MKFLFALCISLFFAGTTHAYVPQIVVQESLHDITVIDNPELSQAFFGELQNFPHTYEIRADTSFTLYTQIRVPELPSSKNNVSGIIIKEQKKGRVEEITRFLAEDALWTVHNDRLIGEEYREGAQFEKELSPGVYRLEVHTPDNLEKYILRVGKNEDMNIGYFELLGRIIDIKRFYETSALWIIISPYVYVPLLGLIVLGSLWYLWRMRRGRVVLS